MARQTTRYCNIDPLDGLCGTWLGLVQQWSRPPIGMSRSDHTLKLLEPKQRRHDLMIVPVH